MRHGCIWSTANIYHGDWEVRRTRKKQKQLGLLTSALPRIRRRVSEDLGAEAGSRTLALAIGVALIDRTAMRIGRERYLDARGTRGAGTLFSRDVVVTDDAVMLKFPAKSGKIAEYVVREAKLCAAIGRVKTIPGKRLLMYRDGSGAARTDPNRRHQPLPAGDCRFCCDRQGFSHASRERAGRRGTGEVGPRRIAIGPQTTNCRGCASGRGVPKKYVSDCAEELHRALLVRLVETAKLGTLRTTAVERHDGLRVREARLAAVLELAA